MNGINIVPQQAPTPVQQKMGYDSSKDVELTHKDIMVGTSYLRVAVVCYNNGSPKISATSGYLRKTDGQVVYNRALKRFTPHELDAIVHTYKELVSELNTVVQPVQQPIAPVVPQMQVQAPMAPVQQMAVPVAPMMAQANITPIAPPMPPQMAIPTPVPVQAQMPQIPVAPTIPTLPPTQAETFNSLIAKFNQMNAL